MYESYLLRDADRVDQYLLDALGSVLRDQADIFNSTIKFALMAAVESRIEMTEEGDRELYRLPVMDN